MMPFQSTAQRGYLFANKPAVAQEFAAATPKGAALPTHVASAKSRLKAAVLSKLTRKPALGGAPQSKKVVGE